MPQQASYTTGWISQEANMPPAERFISADIRTFPVPSTSEEMYLDLLKRTLTRAITAKATERQTITARLPGKRHLLYAMQSLLARLNMELVRNIRCTPDDYAESGHAASNRAEDAETMLGTRQLDQMQAAITDVVRQDVPGDLLEAGVWRGGMTIFMRGVLKALNENMRSVWVVDSFEGLPTISEHEKSASWWRGGDMAIPIDKVRDNFARFNLLDDRVRFLKGYFSDSLPSAPIRQLAVLRLDADLYESTRDVLTHLYPKLSPGGYCIVDDYRNLGDCQRAVDEYRQLHNVTDPIEFIDTRAVYWKKER